MNNPPNNNIQKMISFIELKKGFNFSFKKSMCSENKVQTIHLNSKSYLQDSKSTKGNKEDSKRDRRESSFERAKQELKSSVNVFKAMAGKKEKKKKKVNIMKYKTILKNKFDLSKSQKEKKIEKQQNAGKNADRKHSNEPVDMSKSLPLASVHSEIEDEKNIFLEKEDARSAFHKSSRDDSGVQRSRSSHKKIPKSLSINFNMFSSESKFQIKNNFGDLVPLSGSGRRNSKARKADYSGIRISILLLNRMFCSRMKSYFFIFLMKQSERNRDKKVKRADSSEKHKITKSKSKKGVEEGDRMKDEEATQTGLAIQKFQNYVFVNKSTVTSERKKISITNIFVSSCAKESSLQSNEDSMKGNSDNFEDDKCHSKFHFTNNCFKPKSKLRNQRQIDKLFRSKSIKINYYMQKKRRKNKANLCSKESREPDKDTPKPEQPLKRNFDNWKTVVKNLKYLKNPKQVRKRIFLKKSKLKSSTFSNKRVDKEISKLKCSIFSRLKVPKKSKKKSFFKLNSRSKNQEQPDDAEVLSKKDILKKNTLLYDFPSLENDYNFDPAQRLKVSFCSFKKSLENKKISTKSTKFKKQSTFKTDNFLQLSGKFPMSWVYSNNLSKSTKRSLKDAAEHKSSSLRLLKCRKNIQSYDN